MNQSLSEQLSFIRITEILDNPDLVKGSFDVQHLKNLHAYIFQDSPEHKPGFIRSNTKTLWFKDRELELIPDLLGNLIQQSSHPVPYLNKDIEKTLSNTFKNYNVQILLTLNNVDFAKNLTKLYSKLDYIHPFHEGNSRTLRTFTYLMAKNSKYNLDWNTSNVSAKSRNELYNARDLSVYEHFYNNNLNNQYTKNYKFNNSEEYYIAIQCNNFKNQQQKMYQITLFDIILKSLTKIITFPISNENIDNPTKEKNISASQKKSNK